MTHGLVFAAAVGVCACSSSSPPSGRIVVALTADWEGAYLSPEGLDAIDDLRRELGSAPLTHFVSSAYYTKDHPAPELARTIAQLVRAGDELAVHLHGWRSLAKAAGIQPRLSPSFLTGMPQLMEFDDGDVGFDVDLDSYDVPDLRAMVRTSRKLLEQTKLPVSASFRAGGYLGTPKVLQAIHDEGFTVDSSAIDSRQLDERKDQEFPKRVQGVWPQVTTTSQPWLVQVPGGAVLELPAAAFADYATAREVVAVFEAAHQKLRAEPARDVFVVLGFHQETAGEFASRLGDALKQVRGRRDLADELVFATVEHTAARARAALR